VTYIVFPALQYDFSLYNIADFLFSAGASEMYVEHPGNILRATSKVKPLFQTMNVGKNIVKIADINY
jgi:hypothetical protein